MTKSRSLILVLATLGLTLGLLGTANARTEWCFQTHTGQQICIPVWVEKIPIKVGPPGPGPYIPVQIREISTQLMDILGTSQTKWVLTNGLGTQVFIFDLEAGEAYEVPQVGGP